MNGNHFDIHDLKREYEKGRKEGAIKEINFWLNQLNDIHYCNEMHCEGAIFKNEIKERFEKRLKELESGKV